MLNVAPSEATRRRSNHNVSPADRFYKHTHTCSDQHLEYKWREETMATKTHIDSFKHDESCLRIPSIQAIICTNTRMNAPLRCMACINAGGHYCKLHLWAKLAANRTLLGQSRSHPKVCWQHAKLKARPCIPGAVLWLCECWHEARKIGACTARQRHLDCQQAA